MKNVKFQRNKVSVKLTGLPKQLPWKLLHALVTDLRASVTDVLIPAVYESLLDSFFADVSHAIRHRNIESLLLTCSNFESRCKLETTGYLSLDAQIFYIVAQIKSFVKKYPFKGHNTKDKAMLKFIKSEVQCRLFNRHNYRNVLSLSERHPDYRNIVEDIRKDIERLLGEQPDIGCLLGQAKHGPGVSLSEQYRGGCCTSFYKYNVLPYSVTSGALALAKHAIASDPRWIGALDDWYRRENSIPIGFPIDPEKFWGSVFIIQEASRLTTVPKSYEIDRTIAIEPVMNVYLQLGVDGLIRSKLKKRWGININDQTYNQDLAFIGSLLGEYATLDLVGASDSIALKVCEMLLPPAWFSLLLDLRCKETTIGKDHITLEKVSSMGNGFTFALETLIFAAIIRRAKNYDPSIYSVYGDDIIVHRCHTDKAVEYLDLFGFAVNSDKSFTDGPFRESCGADYYKGINVRPIYLKKHIKTLPDILYLFNSFFEKERRVPWQWDMKFTRTKRALKNLIPTVVQRHVNGPPGHSLDTYMFTENPSGRFTKHGYRKGYALTCKAKRMKNRYADFFFQKLMVSLRGHHVEHQFEWEKRRMKPNNGNAFCITRRGKVTYSVTKVKHWN